ncbi:MAG: aminopeptidase [Ignavibacteria bacterium]|nr:MAG: aminopeptidase [Ignavibacteria bacterium]KAF0155979.1 MAG: aminopeptidase [Ignavibacteria bacterium]
MKRFFSFVVLLAALLTSQIFSQTDPVVQKILEIGKIDNQTMRHLDILCNRIGGRVTGSDAYTTAANWVLSEFRNWGIKAEFDESGELPVGFNRGAWFGKMMKPKTMTLEFGTPAYTSGTKGVQRGHVVILPTTLSKFDSLKEKIKGAWVLVDGISEGWPLDRDSVSLLTKTLVAAGALGTIQLSKLPIHLLDARYKIYWNSLPTLPDIKLLDTQFNEIKSLVETGEEVILEFDIRNFFKPGPIKYHNVIGIIPGTEFPNEFVVLGAHLDSYDHATGAVDNGSGVTTMMEAMRMLTLSGAKPKRSIMVHIFAAEERGLLGSKSWVEKNKKLLPKISVMLNKDFGTNPIVGISVPKVMMEQTKTVVEPILNAGFKYPFKLNETGQFRKAGRGGTDSHSFLMQGVPTPRLNSAGPHQYGRTWHTLFDTYNEIITDAQEESSVKIALLAYGFANLDKILTREGAFVPDGIYADVNTNKGRITLALDYEHAPTTVSNFIGLAEGTIKNEAVPLGKAYYNNVVWHRVVPGHVIQAGMPAVQEGKETEGPGYEFPNEIYTGISHNKAGMLGMANAGPHTNGSQFYITLADRSYLDGNYTLFGWVTEGMDVVNKIAQGDTIRNIAITRIGEKANAFKVSTESFIKMVDEAKAKVKLDEVRRIKIENQIISNDYATALTTSSGLKYIVKKEGNGEKPAAGTVIKANYKGKFLIDGTEFVSTNIEGRANNIDTKEIFDYEVGKTKINPAVDEMLAEMKPGEVRLVIVPSNLAFGANAFYGKSVEGKKRFVISPNTSLVYEIEVIEKK